MVLTRHIKLNGFYKDKTFYSEQIDEDYHGKFILGRNKFRKTKSNLHENHKPEKHPLIPTKIGNSQDIYRK